MTFQDTNIDLFKKGAGWTLVTTLTRALLESSVARVRAGGVFSPQNIYTEKANNDVKNPISQHKYVFMTSE